MLEAYGWQPAIGDPSIMGWVTVWAYFTTALLALILGCKSKRKFPPETRKAQRNFWLIVSVVMLSLGVNKQLDLQSLITAMGKYYAIRDGWYDNKRVVQFAVVSAILAIAALSLALFFYYMRDLLKTNWLAIAGLSFLLIFIVIRATSFHHIDIFIHSYMAGVRMNWLFELGGITAVAISALSLSYYKSDPIQAGS